MAERKPRPNIIRDNVRALDIEALLPPVEGPMTLRGAQMIVANAAIGSEGVSCPCCGQQAKVYARKLGSKIASAFVDLCDTYRTKKLPTHTTTFLNKRSDAGLLMATFHVLHLFGLVEKITDSEFFKLQRKKKAEAHKRSQNAFWQPTKLGMDFTRGKAVIPRYVFIFDNKVISYSSETLTLAEALEDHFSPKRDIFVDVSAPQEPLFEYMASLGGIRPANDEASIIDLTG